MDEVKWKNGSRPWYVSRHDTEIGPQTASEMMKMKPQEVFELVKEELVGKSKEQINTIKRCIW